MKEQRSWTRIASWSVVLALLALSGLVGSALAATGGSHAKGPQLQRQAQELIDANGGLGKRVATELARTKQALDKYRSLAAAKAAGYTLGSACVMTTVDPGASWWGGAMGVHYINQALLKPGPIVATKPPILVYLPTAGGGMQLVAAEYFKPDADQNVKTDGDRPSLFDRAFDGPMLGHSPGMPIHYDLHVWLWKHNPSGMFAPWNPNVTCPTG